VEKMELFKDAKADSTVPSVYCDVKNCVYHSGSDTCAASKIYVGPAHAISSADTACATFKPAEK
jgi:hypothetical protein